MNGDKSKYKRFISHFISFTFSHLVSYSKHINSQIETHRFEWNVSRKSLYYWFIVNYIHDLNLRHHNAAATAIEGERRRQGKARQGKARWHNEREVKKMYSEIQTVVMHLTMHFIEFLCQTIWSTFPIKCQWTNLCVRWIITHTHTHIQKRNLQNY